MTELLTRPAMVSSPAGPLRYQALDPGADRLFDGRCVHWQQTEFGCLECCIATVLDVDLAQVPAGPVGEHTKVDELDCTERLHAFVRARGRRMHYRQITPAVWRGWWIGVSVDPRPGFTHTVVCHGRALVFDPALAVPVPPGYAVVPVDAVHYAITFDSVEDV